MTIMEIRIIENAAVEAFSMGANTPTIVAVLYGESNSTVCRTIINYNKQNEVVNHNTHDAADLIRKSTTLGGIYAVELVSEKLSVFININGIKTVDADGNENTYRTPNTAKFNFKEFITEILKNVKF